jgi:hypothetical protein
MFTRMTTKFFNFFFQKEKIFEFIKIHLLAPQHLTLRTNLA